MRRMHTPHTTVEHRPEGAFAATFLTLGAAVAALTATSTFLVRSQMLHDDRAVAGIVILAVPLVVSAVVFVVAKAVFARRAARWQHAAAATAVLAGLTVAAGPVAEHAFPDPMTRYIRELGGPGRCLQHSAYASSNEVPRASQITFDTPRPGQMTVTPLDAKVPPLRLDQAVRGGTDPLTAADSTSSAILASHRC